MTSTLQQEAGRKLRFSAERTMRTAQRLYEGGYITYMRTDSTQLSDTAIQAARAQARELYGERYLADGPRQYTRKVRNAQEAHEAIRPSGEFFRTPGELARELRGDEFRLYELIWQRTVASQMADARGTTMSVRISGIAASGEAGDLRRVRPHDHLRRLPARIRRDGRRPGRWRGRRRRVPAAAADPRPAGDRRRAAPRTGTPPRRRRATRRRAWSRAMEELGIGRPSTYASIINTIIDRGYVWKRGTALVPSWVAFAVVGLLEDHFGRLVDYDFTAEMEDELDSIASGAQRRTEWLSAFYFGDDPTGRDGSVSGAGGLKKLVGINLEEIDARQINSIRLFTDPDGRDVVVRVGRYGPFLERPLDVAEPDGPTQRASLPEDLPPDELTPEVAEKLFAMPTEGRVLGTHPETGNQIVAREGRYGPYVTEVLAGRRAQVGEAAHRVAVQVDVAGHRHPRRRAAAAVAAPGVGTDPNTGEEITAQNGRYGPYLKRGSDSRSLADEEQLFTVTLEEALAIYAQPKQRGRQSAAAAPPLRELGADPATGKPMVIRDGRFGPYVTDGETNASLRKGDAVDTLTDERGAELLAERRARGPAPKRGGRRRAARRQLTHPPPLAHPHDVVGSNDRSPGFPRRRRRRSAALHGRGQPGAVDPPGSSRLSGLHHLPHLPRAGPLPRAGGDLVDGRAGQRLDFLGRQFARQIPRQHLAFGAFPGASSSRPAAANASAASSRLRDSRSRTFTTSASSSSRAPFRRPPRC